MRLHELLLLFVLRWPWWNEKERDEGGSKREERERGRRSEGGTAPCAPTCHSKPSLSHHHSQPPLLVSKTAMATPLSLLVVGGNGFVGSSIVKAAVARGWNVTSLSRSGSPYKSPQGHSPAWTRKVSSCAARLTSVQHTETRSDLSIRRSTGVQGLHSIRQPTRACYRHVELSSRHWASSWRTTTSSKGRRIRWECFRGSQRMCWEVEGTH